MPRDYELIRKVVRQQPSGTTVSLRLQLRNKPKDKFPWHAVSWRDQIVVSRKNRRFYNSEDNGLWTINASQALNMLEELERLDGLDEKYDDLRRRPDFKVNNSLGVQTEEERSKLYEEITMPDEPWGETPFFVILNDPTADWRKVMIVNREIGTATFRSTTKDKRSSFKKIMRDGSEWYLVNSMQDANVQQARVFLSELREIVPTLSQSS